MKKITFIIVLILFSSGILSAQTAPDTAWTQMYSGGLFDWAWQVQQTTDGGYIMVGDTESAGAGSFDIGVIKTDENGVTEWSKTYGGLYEDRGQSIQLTNDGGYIIAGTTASYGVGSYDIWLVKIDSEGNELWSKTFGGTSWDWGYYVEQTTDGGYIITGCKDPSIYSIWDIYLIKTDSEGNTLWTKTFGGDSYDVGHCVKQTSDGGYIITGYTYSYGAGSSDMWLIKTDGNGNLEWDNTFGDTEPEHGYSVVQSGDEYVITGYTKSYGEGDYDVWLVKTDNLGNEIWNKTHGGPEDDRSFAIQQTSDNNFVVAGFTESFGAGNYDMWLLKIDNAGDTLWTKTIGDDNLNRARSVVQTTDGGYILAGDTYIYEQGEYNYYLVKMDSELFPLPNAPNLISPPNGSTGISYVSVELEWSSLAEATNYQFQYSEDNTFNTGVISGTTTSLTETITNLNQSAIYYWRVRGQNSSGNSPWSTVWSFTTTFQFLDPPSLTAPSNGATNQPITLYLDWTDIADNVGYGYQYDTVSDFSSPVMQEGTTTTNTSYVNVSNLFFGKTYYWRAMTLGSSGNSDWSATWNFSTGITVYNTAPGDGAINQNISLYIDWTDIIGNSGYMYQIDTSQNFNSSLFQEGTTAQNNSYIGVSDLFFGTTYYWRACALSAVDTSIWSNTWIFTTYHTVTNTSPDNGAINQDISLYLDWTDISGNAGYMYQIDTSQSFNSSLLQEGETAQNNSYGGVSDLLFGTTYYWHACAKSAVDTSIWSNTWSFTTLYQMPNAPDLISPANGSTGVSATSVDLEWSSIPDATNYQYQYSEDNTFNSGVHSGTIASLTETIVDLSENTTYYWRVRGQNSSGYSPWSVIWSFTTNNSVGVLNVSNISSIKVFPNPTSKMLTVTGEGIIRLELISFNGQIIDEKNVENDRSIFDLSAMPSGVYLIKVITDKNTIFKKVIKE